MVNVKTVEKKQQVEANVVTHVLPNICGRSLSLELSVNIHGRNLGSEQNNRQMHGRNGRILNLERSNRYEHVLSGLIPTLISGEPLVPQSVELNVCEQYSRMA